LKGYFDSIPQDKLMACLRMRVADRSVLKLIRMWLQSPVVEPEGEGKPEVWDRPLKGTPQGGVISPLLSNLYLHWFDKLFHRADGPAQWAGAKLVRYADDFVVLARYQGSRLREWIESKLEGWLGLEINREKTRGESEGGRSESGLSGVHVPLLRRPARARVAVLKCEPVGESTEEGTGEAARDD